MDKSYFKNGQILRHKLLKLTQKKIEILNRPL